jgi:tetratricopeptide (TPR) repeat protein
MKIFSSKWTIWSVLLLSLLTTSGLLIFKYYYWQILDDISELPSYELWHIVLLPFALVSLLTIITSLFNKHSFIALLSLILCISGGAITYYIPYQVHYLDVYNAFYDDGHDQTHNRNELLNMLHKGDYDGLDEYLLATHGVLTEDPNKERALINAYDAFKTPKNALVKKHLDAWVAESHSYHAYTARGYYLMAHGWEVRGNSFARDIPEDDYKKMRALFAESKQDFLTAIKQQPDNIAAYYALINVYSALGERENADYALQHAINQNPYTYYARYIYMQQRLLPQWGGSKKLMHEYAHGLREFAHGNPRLIALMAAYYEYEAGLLRDVSKTEAAIPLYKKALEYAPYNSIYMSLAWIYKDQPVKLIRQYNAVLKKSPNHLTARSSRAAFYMQENNIEAALKDAKVINKYGYKSYHLTSAAWVFENSGHIEAAIDCYTRSIKYSPDDAYSLKRLADIYSQQGKLTKALDIALQMAKTRPNDPLGNLLAADYMYDLNNEQAVKFIDMFYSQLESGIVTEQSYINSASELRKDIYIRFNVKTVY